jgi:hypothetical protein
MIAKIERTYRRPPTHLADARVLLADSRELDLSSPIDTVITSPPYMNELDYVRDNRLRLWFLLRALPQHGDFKTRNREQLFLQLIEKTFQHIVPRLRKHGYLVLVVGDSRRGINRTDGALLVARAFNAPELRSLALVATYRDRIPDIRRTRRDLAGTKAETVLVYKKTKSSE